MSHKRSKSSAKAYEERRRTDLERKHAERAAASKARNRKIGLIIGGLVVTALVLWGVLTLLGDNTADAGAEPAPATTDSGDQAQQTPPATTGEAAASNIAPDLALAEDRVWTATLATNQGDIEVELDGVNAPQAVASFVTLANEGFFNQTDCHRLTTAGIFVLQCGDPSGNGTGGPGYRFGPIEAAPEDDIYPAGTLAMARVGGDGESMGSQFFIVYEDSNIPSDPAGGYTVFGQVTSGLSIVEDVANAGTITGQPDGRPAQSVIVNEVSAS